MSEPSNNRRDFVRKAIYVAPAILTLAAVPSYAKAGSLKPIVNLGNTGTSRYSQFIRTSAGTTHINTGSAGGSLANSSGTNYNTRLQGQPLTQLQQPQLQQPQLQIQSPRYAAYYARHEFLTLSRRP
jgi:hypothetical protein